MTTKITASRLREVADYAPETGIFTWRIQRKKCSKGKRFGTMKNNGYLKAGIDGVTYTLHRLAWLYVYGEFPTEDIDHVDGDRTNNRIENLRSVCRSANLENQRKAHARNKSTGVLGAYAHGNNFISRIRVRGKDHYLGMFKTIDAAHTAYLAAKRQMHEGNTL
jgi:hypothetical protein